jgi:hypothetical protein
MRFILITVCFVFLVSSISYWYAKGAGICPVPITYRIGSIDDRFGLNQEEARTIAEKAESLWEEISPNELFRYDDTSEFAINFIYDDRQQLASTEEEWRANLDKQEKDNQSLIEKVKSLSLDYEETQIVYRDRRDSYEKQLREYNEKVEKYNAEGGAPPKEFANLEKEAKHLASLLKELAASEKELNDKARQVNEAGERSNIAIISYNKEVEQYNEVYGNLDEYTQGDFKRDRINVYKFSGTGELTSVIAHEFGHALGISHVEGNDSIMYYLMTQRASMELSAEDKEAFLQACADQTAIGPTFRRYIRTALEIIKI